MAQQRIVWTVLPHGRVEEGDFKGRLRVSIVASPRLTPQSAAEQVLSAFPEWLEWPSTLDQVKFRLRINNNPPVDLERLAKVDAGLWERLLPGTTPVAGFEFKNMSLVNLRSFAVRNVLGLLRTYYGLLAVQSASSHPTLLPWKDAHPGLKGMLTDLGTRTQKINLGDRQIELPLPGFSRFFDDKNREGLEQRLGDLVFGPRSRFRTATVGIEVDPAGNPVLGPDVAIRALPPDWIDPAGGGPSAPVMSQFSTAAEYTLYQANRFYRREPLTEAQFAQLKADKQLRRPKLVNVPPSPKPPDYDFHSIVASFADYPMVLRALGLVIDCVLPANSAIDQLLAGAPESQGLMGLELVWGSSHNSADDSCPRTAWFASKERFTTRARTIDHHRGMLRLAGAHDRWNMGKDSPFDVYQVDPDGGALKTVNFLLSAQNLVAKSLALGSAGQVTYTTGDKQPVAALRSGGLGVSRHGRAQVIAQSAAAAALKNAAINGGSNTSKNIVLFTEDVLRGYRVDALPIPGGVPDKWRSLCQRRGTYKFVGTSETVEFAEDEGYVKGASTTSSASDTADPDDHFLHESLFKWTGWSLAAPRPGRTLRARTDPGSGVQGEVPEDVTDEATTGGSGLAVTFEASKGTLPKLRFGVAYRFRARIADLAGNSLMLEDPSLDNDGQVSEAITFWRFEPIDPPALVQRAHVSEGESLERMVVRSNWNATAAAYLTTQAFAAAIALPASADFEYTAVNERHVVPPKSSQLQCEQHGLFDSLFSNPADIKTAYAIAAREAGTLYDAGPSTQIELVTPGSLANVATTASVPPELPTSENPTGDRLAPGQYVVHREALIETPYLPDGASGGVALRAAAGHSLPGVTGPVVLGPSAAVVLAPTQELVLVVAHGKDWPDSQGFRIVLQERAATIVDLPCGETFTDTGVPKWDETNRVLTLFVAKGRIVRLRYASFADKKFVHTLGVPDWANTVGEKQFVRDMAQAGCGWITTPYRSLVLVHATQQPVCQPEFIALRAERNLGDQHAILSSRLRMHGPSTGKFEVEAEWKEWVDDPEKEKPERIDSTGQLGELTLTENHDNLFSLAEAVAQQQPPPAGQAPGSGQERAPGNRHEFGDTKFRLIKYTMRATTRFREYLPAALYALRDEVTRVGPIAEGQAMQVGADTDFGAPVLRAGNAVAPNTVVLSTAPPDEPRVVYVVPTFRWTEAPGNNALDTTRYGNGLRVWLERPWFSSGDGELLGVVILGQDKKFTEIPMEMMPYVTQWGLDPLWDTALPKYRTRVADFPARVADEVVSMRERDNTSVHVIGHRVFWDGSRRMWYADIELDPGVSYMPFVRLGLVRYQPNSLDDAKISKVFLTDFAQVLPRRRAVFQRSGAQLTFRIHGVVPEAGPMLFSVESTYIGISFQPLPGQQLESGRNRVELVVQTRDPNIDSDLAWTDLKVLASSLVPPQATSGVGPVPGTITPLPGVRRIEARATVRDGLGQRMEFSPSVNLGPITAAGAGASGTSAAVSTIDPAAVAVAVDDVVIGPVFDPALWQTTVTLPDTGGKPARLAVREFERYYTDRTIPEFKGGATRQRRVVEERLVYTAFFAL